MMFALIKLAAVAFAVAAVGTPAAAVGNNFNLVSRQDLDPDPVIVNGNFTESLEGTWSYTAQGPQPSNPFHREKVRGNYVLQIEGKSSCPSSGQETRIDFQARIENLRDDQQYRFSYDYRFLKKTKYPYFNQVSISGARIQQKTYTKNVRALVWYTFTSILTPDPLIGPDQTLSMTYINCDANGMPHPDVQFDFFRIDDL